MAAAEHTDIRKTVLELLEYGATSELREYLHDIHGADLAAVLESLPPSVRSLVWYEVSESDMGEMLTELSDQVAESLMGEMEPRTLVRVLQMLDIDEIAEIMPQCPPKVAADILVALDEERRKGLDTVLSYQGGHCRSADEYRCTCGSRGCQGGSDYALSQGCGRVA